MIKIDPYFLYQVGAAIRPLVSIAQSMEKNVLRGRLWNAEHWLDALLNKSIYRLQTCRITGNALLNTTKRILADYDKLEEPKLVEPIGWLDHYLVQSEATAFETVLAAELQGGQLYLVEPKGGYDIAQLTENGFVIFPVALAEKTPEAIEDAAQAARCIAFDLPTAAAFHLHRVNEIVLRRYFDVVTGGKEPPERRTIEKYIDAMKGYNVGDPVVFGALATLAKLHRNPVLHPEQKLDTVDDAISLLGSVRSVVGYMLKALPPEPLTLTSPPSNESETKAIELKAPAATE